MSIELGNQSTIPMPNTPIQTAPVSHQDVTAVPTAPEITPAVANNAAASADIAAPVTAPAEVPAAAPITAPAAFPQMDMANGDGKSQQNTDAYYEKETEALKRIEAAVDGRMIVSNNHADKNKPETARIAIKAQNVRLTPDSPDRVFARPVNDTGEYKAPLNIEFDVAHVDLAGADAARSSILAELARIPGLAEKFKFDEHHHTLPAFNAMLNNFLTQFSESATNANGFKSEEIKTIQKMAILHKDNAKLDKAEVPYIWDEEKISALSMDFSFNSLNAQRLDEVKANIEARAPGIKDYFVRSLIAKGMITSTNADKNAAQQEIGAKAERLKSDLRLLVEKTPDSTPPKFKVLFGLPKDPLKEVTSANDFSQEAMATLSDKPSLLEDVFANAVAFGQQAGIADPKQQWTAIFDMMGPEQLSFFLRDRVNGMKTGSLKDAPEALTKASDSLLQEDLILGWKQRRERQAKETKPEIGVNIVEHGTVADPNDPSKVIARSAKVQLSIPVPDGMSRQDLLNSIADGRPLADRPVRNDGPLLHSTAIAAPSVPTAPETTAVTEAPPVTQAAAAPAPVETKSVVENAVPATVETQPVVENAALQTAAQISQTEVKPEMRASGFAAGIPPRGPAAIVNGTAPTVAPGIPPR